MSTAVAAAPLIPVAAAPLRLAWFLIIMAFLSKVSFAFTGLVPSSSGYFVFQYGLHPYLNVLFNFSAGFFLLLMLFTKGQLPAFTQFRKPYVVFVIGTVALLWVQHFFQLLLGHDESGAVLVLITLLSTTFLIYVYGIVLPAIIPGEKFVRVVALTCTGICAFSLLLLLAGIPGLYKGSRFIGILKHIPYMVTCATVGFLFSLQHWQVGLSWRRHLFFAVGQLVNLYALFLTGTRSAIFAILLGSFVYFITFRTPSRNFQFLRVAGVWLILVSGILFGTLAYDFGKDLLTGKTAIGARLPQDGLSDRMDEVYRGLEMLDRSPAFGLGLLSKFNAADSEDVVDSYNSFQDPHNLFISSAVVGGYPFGLWIAFGFLLAVVGCVAAVLRREPPAHVIGIYLLSHLPILSIYHMHLSLGGMADRLYWLSFGYLGLRWAILPRKDFNKT